MKRNLFISILLILLVVSCSFSAPGEDQEKAEEQSVSKNLIKVSFVQSQTKSLEATYQGTDTVYYLTATPKFSKNGRKIVGEVTSEKLEKNKNNDYFNGGFFEQGSWDFKIDAYIEKGQIKTLVASKTLTDEYISAKHNTIDFYLEDKTESGKGSATISIKVPKVSAYDSVGKTYGVSLTVLIDGTPFSFANSGPTITVTSDTDLSDLLKFDGTIENIPSGFKNIQFIYKHGDTQICSQNIEVRIIPNMNVSISGSMLNEKYVEGSFNIVYVSDIWGLTVASAKDVVEPSETTKVTCTVTDLPQGSTASYQWYLDGVKENGATSSTYNFTSSAQGVFTVTCITTVDGYSKSKSVDILVNDAEE